MLSTDAPDDAKPPGEPAVTTSRSRPYRLAGVIILLLGVILAGSVYWIGARRADNSNDPSMLGFNRAQDRQMSLLYGKEGQLIEDLNEWLKQPGAQALLILAGAGVLAGGCFLWGRILDFEARNRPGPPGPDA